MPQFTPWTVTDPTPNVLYNPAAVDKAVNETIQGRQTIGMNDMSVVARAAAPLLGMSEADAAQAYPGIVADLQRQGFARQAPPTYPGHAVTQSLVQRGMTVPEQVQGGFVTAPGVTDALKAATAPLTSGNTGGGGTAASGGGGGSFLSALADIESGDKNIVSGVDKDSKGLTVAQGGNPSEISQGHFQIQTATWRDFAKQAGVDVNQYPTAMSAPREVQAQVASVIPLSRFGPRTQTLLRSRFGPLDTNQTVGALAGTPALTFAPNAAGPRVATAPPPPFNPNAGPRVAGAPPAGAPGPAATPGFGPLTPVPGAPTVTGQADVPAPVTPSPVALRTGGTDVAGPGAGPDTTLPPVAQPNQLYQTGLPGVTISGPASNALAPPAAAAPAAPVAQVPAAVPAPPATRPATGQNSPQFQAALELNRRAQALDLVVDPTGRTKALAASLRAQAALYMQADSVTVDPNTRIQTKAITGEQIGAAKPLPHYVWDAEHQAWVDTNAASPPVTPRAPALTTTKEGVVIQSEPGGKATVVYTTDPKKVAEQAAAEAQGKGVGGDVAKQMPALVAQGREATQAIGNIDYGMSQLEKARQGGITTGYFADALATTAARLKSLGIPTDKIPFINVDPSAVGNIQTAQKTLAIVSSAILKQALGDSQITDAKIQHFIHAQPGIETDPQALGRVLNWARSQFVYENEMSRAAVAEAANSPTGTLPLNWQAKYFRDKGFAPIYDRGTGEMQQPEGRAPTREPPPGPPATAPINPSARTLDMVYQTPKGPLKWTSDGWVAP